MEDKIITLKVLFFYNLVAIYYTNSKFILNDKTWYIYCIYIKKERKREMLMDFWVYVYISSKFGSNKYQK